jgi:drug/metabolite transporter (DMT)-like permease
VSARTILFTVAALIGFAGNSLLCRVALAQEHIDAASFTCVRLVTGALVLALLAAGRRHGRTIPGSWPSALALFVYAAPFSFAYLRLGAGVGALVLFGAVQATMIGWGITRGERPRAMVWLGLAIAIAGLVGLTVPGATAPDPIGALVMAIAGVAWGAYSLRGRSAVGDPLVETAGNFIRSVPFAIALVLVVAIALGWHADPVGLALASASGALASGVGYTLWYAALRGLTATRAAVVQLLVPVVAAVGGIVLLAEEASVRLALAGAAILLGVATAMRGRPG